MDKHATDVMAVMAGHRSVPTAPQAPGFLEGRIKSADNTGAYFTLPDFDGGKYLFGPAPWPNVKTIVGGITYPQIPPPVGARCLVAFVGSGIDRPWVLGWWVP